MQHGQGSLIQPLLGLSRCPAMLGTASAEMTRMRCLPFRAYKGRQAHMALRCGLREPFWTVSSGIQESAWLPGPAGGWGTAQSLLWFSCHNGRRGLIFMAECLMVSIRPRVRFDQSLHPCSSRNNSNSTSNNKITTAAAVAAANLLSTHRCQALC